MKSKPEFCYCGVLKKVINSDTENVSYTPIDLWTPKFSISLLSLVLSHAISNSQLQELPAGLQKVIKKWYAYMHLMLQFMYVTLVRKDMHDKTPRNQNQVQWQLKFTLKSLNSWISKKHTKFQLKSKVCRTKIKIIMETAFCP